MSAEVHALPARLADCLKLCYLLREQGEPMTAQAVRTLLEAREPNGRLSGSVITHTFERLQARGYVSYTPYYGVAFTEAGEAAAAELVRHYRLLKLFLVRILGVPLDQASAEAEQLEHTLSEVVEERMDALLDHPTEDPHGAPIPDMMGRVQVAPSIRLSEGTVGRLVAIQRITTHDPALVRYLEQVGLVPGVELYLEARTPYGDVLTLRVGDTLLPIGATVADHLLVRILEQPQH
ncbi:MAG TPA: metal-dependent transcriptional regulator [Ktedonobacterales bacterium]|nr:metal-dependent transcriptional regulator [Ktedonobacterales bacterium]